MDFGGLQNEMCGAFQRLWILKTKKGLWILTFGHFVEIGTGREGICDENKWEKVLFHELFTICLPFLPLWDMLVIEKVILYFFSLSKLNCREDINYYSCSWNSNLKFVITFFVNRKIILFSHMILWYKW